MGLDCHVLWVFGRLPMGRFLSQNQQYHSFSTCAQLGVWTGRGEERRGSVFGGLFLLLPATRFPSLFSYLYGKPKVSSREASAAPSSYPGPRPVLSPLLRSSRGAHSFLQALASLSLSPSTFQPSHCLTGSRAAPHLPWRLPCVSGACAPAPRPFLSNAEAST